MVIVFVIIQKIAQPVQRIAANVHHLYQFAVMVCAMVRRHVQHVQVIVVYVHQFVAMVYAIAMRHVRLVQQIVHSACHHHHTAVIEYAMAKRLAQPVPMIVALVLHVAAMEPVMVKKLVKPVPATAALVCHLHQAAVMVCATPVRIVVHVQPIAVHAMIHAAYQRLQPMVKVLVTAMARTSTILQAARQVRATVSMIAILQDQMMVVEASTNS